MLLKIYYFSSGFFDDLIEEVIQEQAAASANVQPVLEEEDMTDDFTNTARKIVGNYLGEALVSSDSDPLDYWRLKENDFPVLAKVRTEVFSHQPVLG